ncbi:MAG: hypothetical protein JXR91_17795 [Deltaproteobacteria bacterium]|nr:hypothetical protein [Deltaproteobacteria bacterium]
MKNTIKISIISLALFLSSACSLITDFTPPENKIDIESELSDTLQVTVDGDTGTLNLSFTSELPADSADAIYDLIGTDILLQVINNENNVGALLSDKPVNDTPDAAGEYQVNVSDNNKDVEIVFYNNSLEGYALSPGGDYSALLHISVNDYFETGDSTYKIQVK